MWASSQRFKSATRFIKEKMGSLGLLQVCNTKPESTVKKLWKHMVLGFLLHFDQSSNGQKHPCVNMDLLVTHLKLRAR